MPDCETSLIYTFYLKEIQYNILVAALFKYIVDIINFVNVKQLNLSMELVW